MKKAVKIFWRIFLFGFLAIVLLIALANFGVFGKMPSLADLENPSILQASEVYATDGTLMGKYYTEHGNRSNVKFREISKYVIDALIATEDERFYDHSGIDFKSTLRAIFTLGHEGGGSTITQQLAKALLEQGSKNKAWRMIEKLKEWIVAVKLEKNFTKEEILTLYLNAVPFGNNIYGIRNAARTFFQKEPDQLSVDEAALLVGMLKGNSIYNPVRNPKAALDRRNVVLGQMAANDKISSADAEKYKALPIDMSHYKKMDENTGFAPYFREILKPVIRDMLKDVKKKNGGTYDIYKDGLRIYTTVNPIMQQYAEEGMAVQMAYLQKGINARPDMKNGTVWKGREDKLERAMNESDRWSNMEDDGYNEKEIRASFYVKTPMKIFAWNAKRLKDTVMTPIDSIKYLLQMEQSGFMAMDPITGEVKAWVGGIDYRTFKNDHVNINTKRQVGSTIKPFLYAKAVEDRGFTPQTVCENVAQFFEGAGWVPNGRRCTGGEISMADALAYSKNCATAYIMKQVGTREFVNFLSQINIQSKIPNYPSIALGTCSISLYEMLWGYTMFAGHGFSTKPLLITRIEDRNGNVILRFDNNLNRKEVLSEATAYTMARMMQGPVDKGTARGMRERVGAAEMGGKTGTTDDNADAWFIGYTPQLLAGAWVGFEYPFMFNESEATIIARPITEYFFRKVLGDKKCGIDRSAKFEIPMAMKNENISADIVVSDKDPIPAAEGDDQGNGTQEDYNNQMNYNYYDSAMPGPKPGNDEKNKQLRKDSIQKSALKKDDDLNKSMNNPGQQPKKKKGFFKRLFGGNKD